MRPGRRGNPARARGGGGAVADRRGPRRRLEVFVLCLSDGGFRGKGKVRSKELVRSCRALGVAQDHVLLADHADLRDGPGRWNKETVAEVVGEHVTRLGVSRLVTFDEHGVSGHVNHRDVHRGVA